MGKNDKHLTLWGCGTYLCAVIFSFEVCVDDIMSLFGAASHKNQKK